MPKTPMSIEPRAESRVVPTHLRILVLGGLCWTVAVKRATCFNLRLQSRYKPGPCDLGVCAVLSKLQDNSGSDSLSRAP